MALVNTPGQGGVLPYTFEPLNQAERSALTPLMAGQPSQYETGYNSLLMNALGGFNPQPYMQQQGRLFNTAEDLLSAARPMTGTQFNERINMFMNPYTAQVLDPTIARMREAADVARGRIAAGRAGSRSFGDTAMGTENAQIESNLGRNIGETAGALNYQGYNTALGQVNAEASRALQGSQLAGVLGGQVGSAAQDWIRSLFEGLQGGQGMETNRLQNQLQAGGYVRNFNQSIADALGGLINQRTNAPATMLGELGSFLNMFPNTQNQVTPAPPNMFDKLGGLAMAGGGMLGGGGGMGTAPNSNPAAALPWLAR